MSEQVRREFTRQAGAMSTAAAFRDESVLGRLSRAVGAVPPGRVLDLACGPGIVAEVMAPLASELVGVDATPEMVRLAEGRLAKAGLTNGRFQERSFSEWAQIVADASRTEPLREVMRALARAGEHAGVRLRQSAGEVRFTHTWLLLVAKPAAPQRFGGLDVRREACHDSG